MPELDTAKVQNCSVFWERIPWHMVKWKGGEDRKREREPAPGGGRIVNRYAGETSEAQWQRLIEQVADILLFTEQKGEDGGEKPFV